MVYKVRHVPTGLFIQRSSYSWHLTDKGKIWNRKPNAKYFPRHVWLRGVQVVATYPDDFEVVGFELVEVKCPTK